jgi:hypothetical protein
MDAELIRTTIQALEDRLPSLLEERKKGKDRSTLKNCSTPFGVVVES